MTDPQDPLTRIAQALERIAPPALPPTDWLAAPAYVWSGDSVLAVQELEAVPLDRLRGIDAQKATFVENARRHAAGLPAHDVLLWGSRGMGKSALVKAAVADIQAKSGGLALVQVGGEADALAGLPRLFMQLGDTDRRFLVFIDDIGFDGPEASSAARSLRSLLEGGAMARPANVRLAVTSNRRAIVERHMSEQDDPINPRDAIDDRMALADRFGLSLGFPACDQSAYLDIITGYAEAYGLAFDPEDALLWARQRGSRSGRIAWHYVTELAGRAGRSLD
ncbi:ATP-binding protein [Blastomonas sp. AAP53]|uniref:ATP-binding protein n=1 Tax=Blastomonas sp. AAP53 TaxID=1248760 RepID=UPI0002D27837|nr:ATP-binding protein [Blastomonas sp. AAP53]